VRKTVFILPVINDTLILSLLRYFWLVRILRCFKIKKLLYVKRMLT